MPASSAITSVMTYNNTRANISPRLAALGLSNLRVT